MDKTLASERVIVQSPTSFTGAARRAWKLTRIGPAWAKIVAVPAAVVVTLAWWVFCTVWLVAFGVLLVPWRLVRRGQRQRRQDRLRHRERLGS